MPHHQSLILAVKLTPEIEVDSIDPDLKRLQDLIDAGEAAEAFFMARSLLTSGETWAEEWMEKAQQMLD